MSTIPTECFGGPLDGAVYDRPAEEAGMRVADGFWHYTYALDAEGRMVATGERVPMGLETLEVELMAPMSAHHLIAQRLGVKAAEDLLRSADATLQEAAYAGRVARFKERMLAEESTSVSEGSRR